jgi:hypothetical protein
MNSPLRVEPDVWSSPDDAPLNPAHDRSAGYCRLEPCPPAKTQSSERSDICTISPGTVQFLREGAAYLVPAGCNKTYRRCWVKSMPFDHFHNMVDQIVIWNSSWKMGFDDVNIPEQCWKTFSSQTPVH